MIFSNHFTYLIDLLNQPKSLLSQWKVVNDVFQKTKLQGRDTMFYVVLANKNPFISRKTTLFLK